MSLQPTSLVVMGEPVRLQQIAWNLVSNAIKFTDPGGKVNVTTGVNGSQAYLMVVDTGVGIAPDFLPHVFDRFRQADGSTSRRHGGLGLGLAIADALAKMHGGRLEAQSVEWDRERPSIYELNSPRPGMLFLRKSDQKVHSLDGLDVLIVEDSEDTLLLLSTIFGREGARVITAASAAEACKRAIMKRPHIIVSDIGMPETDGYQLLEQLRILPGLSDVPAIAISGYASEEDRERASGCWLPRPRPQTDRRRASLQPHPGPQSPR